MPGYFPVKPGAFPASWGKKEKKKCAVLQAACSCPEAILLDFLKVMEEVSLSIHMLRIFLELLKGVSFYKRVFQVKLCS